MARPQAGEAEAPDRSGYQRRAWSRIPPRTATSGTAVRAWSSGRACVPSLVIVNSFARRTGDLHPRARSRPRSARSMWRNRSIARTAYRTLISASPGTRPRSRPAPGGRIAACARRISATSRPPRDGRPPVTQPRSLPALVGLPEIREAAETLRGVAVRTPLVPFGDPARRQLLKAESLQPIGAFKIRGAYVAAASLGPEARARGLITYSSGNHAQGVARAARLFGVPAVIVMPSDAPVIKRARVEADGAEVIVVGTASDERRLVAEAIASDRGLTVIPPFDDPRIVAGQGTVGLEIAQDRPDVAAVLVPIGGGGLAAGVAAAIRAIVPAARVIGVEPDLAADAKASLEADEIVSWEAGLVSRTIADGTRTQAIGRLNFAHLRLQLDAIVTVSEAEIAAAVRLAAEEARLVVEPSGALPIAAMRFHAAEAGLVDLDRPIVGVVSGGNVDPDRYRGYLDAPLPAEA